MSKMDTLQSALNSSSGRTQTPPPSVTKASPRPVAAKQPALATTAAPSSRAGKENIAAWLPVAYKKSIRLVQAKKDDPALQQIIAEALNDLFVKYNVPTVSE